MPVSSIDRRDSVVGTRRRRMARTLGWIIVGCSFAAAACCYISYLRDSNRLGNVAREVTAGATSPSDRVLALLHFVSDHHGTRQNERFFVLRRMRATPLQVLEDGGDCADRSRLLCALLRAVDIPATMAMCFDRETGAPTHTLVEAEPARGRYMVVDPAYDLYFPKPNQRSYYGLLDLRRDPGLVTRRIDELCASAPLVREVERYYLRAYSGYHQVATINWSKHTILRPLHDWLRKRYGDRIYRFRRPTVLEEPKLLVGTFCLLPGFAGLAAIGGAALLGMVARIRSRRRSGRPRFATGVRPSRA